MHVRRSEILELNAPQRWSDMHADVDLVTLAGASAHRALQRARKPFSQVLPDLQTPGIVDKAALSIGERLRELPPTSALVLP